MGDLFPGEAAAIADPRGHDWKRKQAGDVDFFALDFENLDGHSGHNGPACIKCGFSYCIHCYQNGPPEPCGCLARMATSFREDEAQ